MDVPTEYVFKNNIQLKKIIMITNDNENYLKEINVNTNNTLILNHNIKIHGNDLEEINKSTNYAIFMKRNRTPQEINTKK